MFSKVIEAVKRTGHGSGFDSYFSTIYSRGQSGVPTYSEAQRDYREVLRHSRPGI